MVWTVAATASEYSFGVGPLRTGIRNDHGDHARSVRSRLAGQRFSTPIDQTHVSVCRAKSSASDRLRGTTVGEAAAGGEQPTDV